MAVETIPAVGQHGKNLHAARKNRIAHFGHRFVTPPHIELGSDVIRLERG